jgi:hypothetical protein
MVLARPVGQGLLRLNPLRRACEFVGQRNSTCRRWPVQLGPPANEGCGYRVRGQERLNSVGADISGEQTIHAAMTANDMETLH